MPMAINTLAPLKITNKMAEAHSPMTMVINTLDRSKITNKTGKAHSLMPTVIVMSDRSRKTSKTVKASIAMPMATFMLVYFGTTCSRGKAPIPRLTRAHMSESSGKVKRRAGRVKPGGLILSLPAMNTSEHSKKVFSTEKGYILTLMVTSILENSSGTNKMGRARLHIPMAVNTSGRFKMG